MPRHLLRPEGEFPRASLIRRLAAMFYDFLLSVALMLVVGLIYQQGILRIFYSSDGLLALSEAGGLDNDPILATLVLLSLFGFFAKFWTHNGQTLGMQVWGIRVQNRDGTAIDLQQALIRFFIAIGSWLILGLGYLWMLWDKDRMTWHDRYSESVVVRISKKKPEKPAKS